MFVMECFYIEILLLFTFIKNPSISSTAGWTGCRIQVSLYICDPKRWLYQLHYDCNSTPHLSAAELRQTDCCRVLKFLSSTVAAVAPHHNGLSPYFLFSSPCSCARYLFLLPSSFCLPLLYFSYFLFLHLIFFFLPCCGQN